VNKKGRGGFGKDFERTTGEGLVIRRPDEIGFEFLYETPELVCEKSVRKIPSGHSPEIDAVNPYAFLIEKIRPARPCSIELRREKHHFESRLDRLINYQSREHLRAMRRSHLLSYNNETAHAGYSGIYCRRRVSIEKHTVAIVVKGDSYTSSGTDTD
jgi:hypothetical protein